MQRSPGDLVVFTAAVHSLIRAYPEYRVSVESVFSPMLDYDPHITGCSGRRLLIDYQDYLSDSLNYAEAYCLALSDKLNLPIKLTCSPKLYLSEEERDNPYPGLPEKYVVFNAGAKPDMPVKQIPHSTAEQVIQELDLPCVQIGRKIHNQPLKGAISLIDETSLRDVMRIAYHALVGWGGDTFLYHCCCSLGTPYVCCASGRLDPAWLNLYDNCTMLSAYGSMDCCETKGCLLRRIVPLGDSFDSLLCKYPRLDQEPYVAECMMRIKAEEIITAIKFYL